MPRVLVLCILCGLVACGDDATEPVIRTPASLVIVSGDSQADTVGQELPQPLVVRVVDADNAPIQGQVINFRVLAGGGSVFAGVAISDEAGEARERWLLGTVAGETQVVEARAVDTQTGEGLVFETFTAVGLPDAATSLEMLSDTVVLLTSIGDTTTLSAQVVDDFGNAVDPQPSIDWTSSDGSIATVFSTGVVTAIGLGSTTILAVGGGLSATTRVTVEQAPNSIVLSPESISLGGPGDSTVILATVSDARGAEITVPNLTWTSSNTGVVTVDSVGLVRAVTFGSAEITVLASGGGQTAEATLSVTVDETALSVTTAELTDAVENVLYDQLLTAQGGQGGQGGYTWALAAGSPPLPDGLALVSNGNITGVPTTPGIWNFVVQVTSGTQSAGRTLSITVNETLEVDTGSLLSGVEGVAYLDSLRASGGDEAYVWSVTSGSLPSGLGLDARGVISGTPTTADTYTFTVGVTSGDGQSDSKQLLLFVYPVLTITSTALDGAAPNVAYVDSLAVVGGDGFYQWSVSDRSLPNGLMLSQGGVVSGTPSETAADSTWTFTLEVESGDGQVASQELTLAVNPLLEIATDALPDGEVGVAYSETLTATGGDGSYSWSVAEGVLPEGLTLNASSGVIEGTPTNGGRSETFTVQVLSGDGQVSTRSLSLSGLTLTWHPATPLPVGPSSGSAAAASDGDRIYVVGDFRMYVYDPVADVWMTGAQHGGNILNWLMLAALPGDGVHLISESSTSSHLSYDRLSDTWSPRAAIPTLRRAGVAEVVDGKLYVIGGVGPGCCTYYDVVEIYDPGTDSWTSGAGMSMPRITPASAVINGMIYVAGGETTGIVDIDVLERYDPAADEWITLAPLPRVKDRLGGGEVDGLFCVFGGSPGSWETFCYDPVSNTWTQEVDMITGRTAIPSTTLGGGLYAMGGRGGSGMVVEILRR